MSAGDVPMSDIPTSTVATANGLVQDVGWPFLVAAGRVRDYAVLVGPDFLVGQGEQGLLGVAGSAVEGAPVESRRVRMRSGRELVLVYAARLLTAADVAARSDASGSEAEFAIHDEFGRPLTIIVGIVTDNPRATDPAPDLVRAENAVLPAYRRFRADEAGYRTEPSRSRPMHSLGRLEGLPVAWAPSPGQPDVPRVASEEGLPVASDSSSGQPHVPRATSAPNKTDRHSLVALVVVAVVLAVVLATLLSLRFRRTDTCVQTTTTPTTTATTSRVTAPAGGAREAPATTEPAGPVCS